MYQSYQTICEELYQKLNQKKEKGYFQPYGDVTESDLYNQEAYYLFSNYKTHNTVGYEGEANISFALIKCLYSIDSTLAQKLEQKLSEEYSRCKFTGQTEDICQKYFHYGKEHVENIVEMIDRYHNTLEDINQSNFSPEILEVLPTIKNVLNEKTTPDEKIEKYITELENSNIDLTSFCDYIESSMKNAFSKNLNEKLQSTISKLQNNHSRLKLLNGQDFDLMIHSSLTPDDFVSNSAEEFHNIFSTSLIDDKNVRCYQSHNMKFAFYQPLKNEDLVAAFSRDASTEVYNDNTISSFAIPDYVPVENFKDKTREGKDLQGYSEIFLEKKNIAPDAVVCFDFVQKKELDIAEKYGLDIILIETKKYENMLVNKPIDEKGIKKADLSKFEKEKSIKLPIPTQNSESTFSL